MRERPTLEPGDWVRFRGMTRIYEVEEIVEPQNDWDRAMPMVKVIGSRMNQKIDDVEEVRKRKATKEQR